MKKHKYLFEIGTEEIPASYINPAVKMFADFFKKQLDESFLTFESIKTYSTPRRMALEISGLPSRQMDRIEEIKGPPKKVAYDDGGNLTRAGAGFLKSKNLSEKDIEFTNMGKGVYLTATKKIHGKATPQILAEISKDVFSKINFPKSMHWGKKSIGFARPVRWLLAIFDEDVVHFKIDNLHSDRFSFGNRFEKVHNKIEIPYPEIYEEILETHFVIPDSDKRKRIILAQLDKLYTSKNEKEVSDQAEIGESRKEELANDYVPKQGLGNENIFDMRVVGDKRLLDIVTNLVEFPTAVSASYDEKYLKLPKLIIQSTLTEHQKYFAVEKKGNSEQKLTNHFVFISNGNPAFSEGIKYGNQRVVKARLEDAEFFFETDTKHSLAEFIPKLKNILFQEKLGNLYEKTQRIKVSTKLFAEKLLMPSEEIQNVIRAAELCKADLATLMLGEKEFTKLQGYVGSVYAKLSGENSGVANAIREHYYYEKEDLEKMSKTGALVALADNLDTICGIMGIGMLPTGSKDPFALRRSGNLVVQILNIHNFEFSLKFLIDRTFESLSSKIENFKHRQAVHDFFEQRARWLLKQNRIDYDVADAVMATNYYNIPDLLERAKHLQQYKSHEDFRKLIIGFKRASNILESSDEIAFLNPALFQEPEEKELYKIVMKILPEYNRNAEEKKYKQCLDLLVTLKTDIDKFFDTVMVMVKDKDLRENRMALLRKINKGFLKTADLSKIVME
ncbi:MAG: glycine--tRNA ligase subunit beta [Candidatus Cloacimonadota bacterium]|nr:glycine--tRNA ligase subunit beta [Candidatus Cloacimonadota bacterium]